MILVKTIYLTVTDQDTCSNHLPIKSSLSTEIDNRHINIKISYTLIYLKMLYNKIEKVLNFVSSCQIKKQKKTKRVRPPHPRSPHTSHHCNRIGEHDRLLVGICIFYSELRLPKCNDHFFSRFVHRDQSLLTLSFGR